MYSSATVTHTSHKQAAGRPGFFASLGAILATLSRRRTPPRAACSAAINRRSRRCRPPAAHCRRRTALPTAPDGIGAVGPGGPGGAGGDANAIRRARAELSSPEGAHEAGKRSIAADRSVAGTDGALWRGIIKHGDGQLRLAAGHQGIDRVSWPATGTCSRACRRRPVVMGQGIKRAKEGRGVGAPGRRSRQLTHAEEVGHQAPPRRRK